SSFNVSSVLALPLKLTSAPSLSFFTSAASTSISCLPPSSRVAARTTARYSFHPSTTKDTKNSTKPINTPLIDSMMRLNQPWLETSVKSDTTDLLAEGPLVLCDWFRGQMRIVLPPTQKGSLAGQHVTPGTVFRPNQESASAVETV